MNQVKCTSCAHFKASRCHNAKTAQLSRVNRVAEIGRDFASLAQWCNGHKATP